MLWYTLRVSKGWSIEYRLPPADEIEEDPSFIGDVLAYMNSPEGELFIEVGEIVSVMLERADVDAKERQIIWDNGARLSIAASTQRIGVEHPDYPLDIIEQNIIIWLESEFAPPTYTPQQLDELDQLTEAWIQDHTRQAKRAQKGSRTRHS
jgi:hypothetical protein